MMKSYKEKKNLLICQEKSSAELPKGRRKSLAILGCKSEKYSAFLPGKKVAQKIHEQFEKLDFEKNGRFWLENEKSEGELEIYGFLKNGNIWLKKE